MSFSFERNFQTIPADDNSRQQRHHNRITTKNFPEFFRNTLQ